MVKPLLHLEGATTSLTCAYLIFIHLDQSWWLLPLFILAPDISMLGYLINPRIGATLYNSVHTYALTIPIALIGLITTNNPALITGLLLTGHIGMDRTFGYGLKYPTQFKDTHFNRLENPPPST